MEKVEKSGQKEKGKKRKTWKIRKRKKKEKIGEKRRK